MPIVDGVARRHHDDGLAVVGVNTSDEMASAREWLKRHAVSYAIAFDQGQHAAGAFGVENLPTLVVIDKEGKNRRRAHRRHERLGARVTREESALKSPFFVIPRPRSGRGIRVALAHRPSAISRFERRVRVLRELLEPRVVGRLHAAGGDVNRAIERHRPSAHRIGDAHDALPLLRRRLRQRRRELHRLRHVDLELHLTCAHCGRKSGVWRCGSVASRERCSGKIAAEHEVPPLHAREPRHFEVHADDERRAQVLRVLHLQVAHARAGQVAPDEARLDEVVELPFGILSSTPRIWMPRLPE